jgi:hypothetical protein
VEGERAPWVTGSCTAVGFTDDGFNVKLTLENASRGYTLQVGTNTLSSRNLAQGTSTIAAISVFSVGAGNGLASNLRFNNHVITAVQEVSPVIVFPVVAVIAETAGSIYRRQRRATA